jgi:hypothetical protein
MRVVAIVNLRGAYRTVTDMNERPCGQHTVLLFQPDIGQVLSDEMTGRDMPAFKFARRDDDPIPPQ